MAAVLLALDWKIAYPQVYIYVCIVHCRVMRIAVQDRAVVVLSNLKPRNMRGVKSNGMLLAASDAAHERVELLSPPPGAMPGERIWFGSEADQANQAASATPNQVCQSILAFYPSLPFCSFFSNGAQQLGLN